MKSVTFLIAFALLTTIVLDAGAPQSRQRPSAPATTPPTDQAAPTLPPGNIAHGGYLAEHVAMCIECHSGRDAQGNILDSELFFGGPIPCAAVAERLGHPRAAQQGTSRLYRRTGVASVDRRGNRP